MQKQATQIFALLAVMLIIWFVVPLISFNHAPLLPTKFDRLLVICTVLIFWIAFLVFKMTYANKQQEKTNKDFKTPAAAKNWLNKITTGLFSKKSKDIEAPVATEHGPYLEANLILLKHFELVKIYCRKHFKKKKQPVYLIVGNKYTGKSTLLKKSALSLKTIPITAAANTPASYYHDESEQNSNCIWNIHDNCIFVDTPGDFAGSEISETLLTPWRSLIDLLLKKYQTFPIKALILVISVYDLLADSQQANGLQLYLLKQRITDVKKYYGEAIPLYIIFNKCDAVPGFTEFFDHLSIDERQQSFNIIFNKNLSEETAVSQFKQQYELLLQQISRLQILRMHQEHNAKKRTLISQFPMQMEQLQKTLINVVTQLMEKTYTIDAALPTAIYFTSGEQGAETVDILFQKLQTSFNLPEKQLIVNKPKNSKSYFIHNLFQDLIHCEEPSKAELTVSKKTQYAIYGAAAAVIAGFAVINLIKFTESLTSLNDVAAKSYALMINTNSSSSHPALALATEVNKASDFWLGKKIALSDAQPSANAPSAVVKTIPEKITAAIHPSVNLQNYIEHILTDNKTSPAAIYSSLKAYLMLGEPEHLQAAWLTQWLKRNAVKHHLIDAAGLSQLLLSLQQHHPVITLQPTIIAAARQQLTALPPQYLAFLMLQDAANFSNEKGLLVPIADKTITVPFLFTAKGLQTIFLNNFDQYVNATVKGDWVLGKITAQATAASISEQLISIYTTSYANWWNKVFYGLRVPTFTNMESLTNFTALLNDPHRGIIQAYTLILQNTNPNIILPASVTNPTFEMIRNNLSRLLNTGIANLMLLNLSDVQNALSQFNQFLNSLTISNNIPQSAFLVIKAQFANPSQPNILTGFGTFATTLPEPLNTEFSSLAQQSQQLTEQAAASYLQNLWVTQVLQFYNEYLANRYPLYSDSVEDVSLQAFTKFFAPDGILQSFYQNNLAMFINSNSSVWQWQTMDGLNLPLNNSLLLALEKGRIITTMFFPNNSDQLSVNFTLQQVETMPIVQSFSLNMNGQSLHDPQGTRNISSFIWPGNSDNLGTQLSFINVNGQRAETDRQGVWAWFRILDMNTIRADGSSQQYNVTFDVDGTEARYRLAANNPINPFIPGIINSFRLPNSVTN